MPISFTRATWADYVGAPFLSASEVNRWETALDALINGTSRAVYRDGDTMTGGLTLSAGNLNVNAGAVQTAGVTRISSVGVGTFTDLTDSGLTPTRVVYAGTGGNLQDSDALTFVTSGGQILKVGNGASSSARIDLDGATGSVVAMRYRLAGVLRWAPLVDGASTRFQIGAYDAAGTLIDLPFEIQNPDTGRIYLNRTTTIASAEVSDLTPLGVVAAGTSGALLTNAGFTHTTTGGVTRAVSIGDYAVAADVFFFARQTAGQQAGLGVNDSAANRRWTVGISTGTNFRVGRWTNSSTKIDDPIDIVAGSAGLITLGGNSGSTTNFTGAIQTSGVTRISSTGAGSLASVTVADLTANLPVYADASKKLATESASAFRTRIGAQAQDAKLDAISAGETAGRVWTGVYSSALGSYAHSFCARVKYGNGVFIRISNNRGDYCSSTDNGLTWTLLSFGSGRAATDVVWHAPASLWVAVGLGSACMTSPDGVTWTDRTIAAGQWNSVESNGTILVAVSTTCQTTTSTNGTSWTAAVVPSGIVAAGFRSVCWSASHAKWLAAGPGNSSTSANGTTWTTIVNPSSDGDWCGVINGNFVSVGSAYASWSADGVTWNTPRRTPSAKGSWYGFATNGVVAVIGGDAEETLAISGDGSIWLPVDMGYTGSFYAVGYGNGWFLLTDALGYCFRSRG